MTSWLVFLVVIIGIYRDGVRSEETGAVQKRILLNSQEDLVTECLSLKATINMIEGNIQTIVAKNKALETEVQTLSTKTLELENKIQSMEALETDVHTLHTDIQTFSTANQALGTDIQALKQTNTQMETEIQTIEQTNKELETKLAAGGSVYVRWGRNVCPDGSQRLYKGFMAGHKYRGEGSGTDSLCLPEDPVWGRYHDGDEDIASYRGRIYGTEINTNDDVGVFPYNVIDQDMPCAVCRTNNSVNVMIPARNVCYPGWREKYNGYLMADSFHSEHKGMKHICMDGEPEFLQHGGTSDDQHVVFLVDGQCGSLPCPPYVQGRELTCVVCSQ